MEELDKILGKIEIINEANLIVKAICENCGWEGQPSECTKEWEQDGWENPGYWVSYCPKCEPEDSNVIFLRKNDLENRNELL